MDRATRRYAMEVAGVCALALGWVVWIVGGFGGPTMGQAVSNVGLAAAAVTAGAVCGRAAVRANGRARRVWALLAASALAWGSGQVVWTIYESVLGREVPFPSLADVGYLSSVPFAVAALLTLASGHDSMASRLRTVTDGLLIATSLLVVSWTLVLGPLVHAGGDGLVTQVIVLAYPIGDIVVVTILLYAVLRRRASGRAALVPLHLVGAGLTAIALADSGFTYLTLTEAYASGNYIDLGWFVGFVLLLLAARRPSVDQAGAGEAEQATAAGSDELLVPFVMVGVALLTTMFEFVQSGTVDPFVSWARSLLLGLIIGRQVLVARELSQTRERVKQQTERLRASEQRFAGLVQHSSDVVTVIDRDGTVRYQSESLERVFGYSVEETLGEDFAQLLRPDSVERLREALSEVAQNPYSVLMVEVQIAHRNGHACQAEMTITNLLDNPNVNGLVLNTHDISERKLLEDQLVHQAFHDSLTGLANRALFKDRLSHALHRADRRPPQVAVLFVDLDGFKEVNDSLGHAAGDGLLVQVADRMSSSLRPGDTIARFGGDEFAILMENAESDEHALALCRRITELMALQFEVDDHTIEVQGSIGFAMADGSLISPDQLMRNADLAMYKAKAAGRGCTEQYDPSMHAGIVARFQFERDLRTALDLGQLVLHYQPTVSLATGAITGVEALLRWNHPERGLVPPMEFIPVAEQTGLIRPIGRWVLQEACRQARQWQQVHPQFANLTVSVNISPRQLSGGDLVAEVTQAVAESGLAAEHLILELTESVLAEYSEATLALFHAVKSMGVRIAIDDFGTGYSSLAYLHRFPVDVLKIDRSFVDMLRSDSEDDAELVRTIVRLGKSLRMSTVAEGIEDAEQYAALLQMGCDLGQGFHMYRPVPALELAKSLSAQSLSSQPVAVAAV